MHIKSNGCKKILIFGCSYSAGSYSYQNQLIRGSQGWYHFINYFKESYIDVVSVSGGGMWAWYQIALMLQHTNRLDYDEIWVQETFEPRVGDFKKSDIQFLAKNWSTDFYIDPSKSRATIEGINVLNVTCEQNKLQNQFYFHDDVIEDVYKRFDTLFKKHKVYVIPFCRHIRIKYKNIKNISKNVTIFHNLKHLDAELDSYRGTCVGSHQILAGTKMMGRRINEEIKKMVN